MTENEWKNNRVAIEEKRLAAFLALPATPYNGEPIMPFYGDEMLMDEDAVSGSLRDLFYENPDGDVPLFCGSRRVTLQEPQDLLEYWNENWEYEQEIERHHVPQAVWDAEEALNKAIREAVVGYWESDPRIRVVLPESLIEEARREAREEQEGPADDES